MLRLRQEVGITMKGIDKDSIERICSSNGVEHLFLFGSAKNDLVTANDLDFVVEFKRMTPAEHVEAYFGLLESLVSMFGKPIDLVERRSVRNPYFLQELKETMVPVYEAA